jgi:hypothetical protein
MKSLWSPSARQSLLSRIDRITPETRPLWGRMNAAEMVAHCARGMKMGLGELETRERRTIFRYWPLKHLFVYWVRFPRSAPAPREMVTCSKPVTWDSDLAALRDSLDRFAGLDPHGSWPVHPVFGRLSGKAWGALGWRHLDHHLRQFGL